MRLAADRFYDAPVWLRTSAVDHIEAQRLTYETSSDLYDIMVMPDGERIYRKNMADAERGRIHRAIEAHFGL